MDTICYVTKPMRRGEYGIINNIIDDKIFFDYYFYTYPRIIKTGEDWSSFKIIKYLDS